MIVRFVLFTNSNFPSAVHPVCHYRRWFDCFLFQNPNDYLHLKRPFKRKISKLNTRCDLCTSNDNRNNSFAEAHTAKKKTTRNNNRPIVNVSFRFALFLFVSLSSNAHVEIKEWRRWEKNRSTTDGKLETETIITIRCGKNIARNWSVSIDPKNTVYLVPVLWY